ncbi:MAG: hypothetical protein WKF63_09630 [Thermomicrobiales bacterium]
MRNPATHVTILTRYGPLPIHRNWIRNKAAIKKAYTRVRRGPNQT